jgi:hypothetical protein
VVSTLNEWTPEQYEFEPRESHLKRNLAIAAVCIFTVIVIMVFIAILGLRWGSNVYSNAEMGFRVTGPEGWEIEEKDFGGHPGVIFSKSGEGAIIVVAMWIQPSFTLEDLVSWEHEAIETYEYENFVILSERSRAVAGAQAHEILFEFWQDGEHYKKKDVIILRTTMAVTGKRAYSIWCEAKHEKYDNLESAFEGFIQSFRFI